MPTHRRIDMKKILVSLLFGCSLAFGLQRVQAFDAFGHTVVMQIALDTLVADGDTHTLQVLETIRAKDPRTLRRNFLIMATWPDILKHPSAEALSSPNLLNKANRVRQWHFVDIPYDG